MEHRTFTDEDVELSLLSEVPLSFAKGNLVMPIRRQDGGLLGEAAWPLAKFLKEGTI
jgi:hypothetical protein